jgi:hypothetical protein
MADTAPAAQDRGKKEVLLALKGHVILNGNKLGFEYIEVTELPISGKRTIQELGRSLCYLKRLVGGESVGSIVKVNVTDDFESVYVAGRALTGKRFEDTETVTRWAATSEARKLALEQSKANKKAASVDPLRVALAPIKRAYAEASTAGRVQLLAKIIQLVTAS